MNNVSGTDNPGGHRRHERFRTPFLHPAGEAYETLEVVFAARLALERVAEG